jgi:hypothetical protein
MKSAHACDCLDDLINIARAGNEEYLPPLPDNEVVKIANSAWDYTERGENRFGRRGVYFDQTALKQLVHDPDVIALLAFLRAANRPKARFWIADGMAEGIGWSRHKLREARRRAMASGLIKSVTPPKPGRPAVYVFGNASGIQRQSSTHTSPASTK